MSPPSAAAARPVSSAEAAGVATPAPATAPHREPAAKPPREAPARDITPRLGLEAGGEAPSRRGLWIAAALVGVLALAAGAWLWLGRAAPRATTTPPTTVSPEVLAAMARVKELEGRIAQMERQRAEAETKAAEEARKKVEAQAAARGRAVDPAALQKAQEEARQTARAEQEHRQQQELGRIAEARRPEEKRIAEASPSPPLPTPEAVATLAPTPTPEAAAHAAAPPTTTPAAPATTTAAPSTMTAAPPTTTAAAPPAAAATPTASPTTPGMTVEASDPRLVRPVLVSRSTVRYPPAAEAMGASGVVEVLVLIDDRGRVVEASVVRSQPAKLGFEQAALEQVRSMQYRPGSRDGVPVKVRMPIIVNFKPRQH